MNNQIDTLSTSAIRVVGAENITKAKSGHPGIVLGAAPIMHTLYTRHINVSNEDSKWFNRDRFVLSAGHGSMLLYEILSLSGFGLTTEDLRNFRQKDSRTPGHPEYKHVNGVEITTGPLGQGFASAVGMALAESFLAAKFNHPSIKIIDHYTYVLCGDGDLQEGVTMEAASLAGHLGLNKLIVLYDSNDVQLDGDVELANTEDTKTKFEAMGWNYILVKDGNDCDSIDEAITLAKKSTKPSIVEIKTIIGYGAPNQGDSSVHGKPMPEEDIQVLKKNLGYKNHVDYEFPEEVKDFYKKNVINRGNLAASNWNALLQEYKKDFNEDYDLLLKFMYDDIKLTEEDIKNIPSWEVGTSEATRNEMGKVLDYISSKLPNIIGGSADLSSSTKVKGADGIYSKLNPLGRNIKFGVREHAMGAIINGITLHGGLKAFCSGFFVFSDYLKPAVRQASIMGIPSMFFFSHDSVCVGEDGPTHQPIEQLTMFRSMPNTNVVRPADAKELTSAMLMAVNDTNTYPTIITTSRQGIPNLEETSIEKTKFGAYVVKDVEKAKFTLISCGSDLDVTIEAAKLLDTMKVPTRVVSMPSQFLFDMQSDEYKKSVITDKSKTMAIEMGSTLGWYKYANYVFGIDTFGASMPLKFIHETYGFTKENIANTVKEYLKK